jgi:hypothetical protein
MVRYLGTHDFSSASVVGISAGGTDLGATVASGDPSADYDSIGAAVVDGKRLIHIVGDTVESGVIPVPSDLDLRFYDGARVRMDDNYFDFQSTVNVFAGGRGQFQYKSPSVDTQLFNFGVWRSSQVTVRDVGFLIDSQTDRGGITDGNIDIDGSEIIGNPGPGSADGTVIQMVDGIYKLSNVRYRARSGAAGRGIDGSTMSDAHLIINGLELLGSHGSPIIMTQNVNEFSNNSTVLVSNVIAGSGGASPVLTQGGRGVVVRGVKNRNQGSAGTLPLAGTNNRFSDIDARGSSLGTLNSYFGNQFSNCAFADLNFGASSNVAAWRFDNCVFEGSFGAWDIRAKRFEFTNCFFRNSSVFLAEKGTGGGASGADANVFTGCRFEDDLSISSDLVRLVNCEVQGDLIVNPAASGTLLVGCTVGGTATNSGVDTTFVGLVGG